MEVGWSYPTIVDVSAADCGEGGQGLKLGRLGAPSGRKAHGTHGSQRIKSGDVSMQWECVRRTVEKYGKGNRKKRNL